MFKKKSSKNRWGGENRNLSRVTFHRAEGRGERKADTGVKKTNHEKSPEEILV